MNDTRIFAHNCAGQFLAPLLEFLYTESLL